MRQVSATAVWPPPALALWLLCAGSEFIGAARRFGAFKLLMFFQDENPPHVHITGRDFAAKIRLANGELIAGDAPNRVLAEARRWIQENQAQLLQLWNEFQSGPE